MKCPLIPHLAFTVLRFPGEQLRILRELSFEPYRVASLIKDSHHSRLALDGLVNNGYVEVKNRTAYITLDGLEWWDWECFARYGVNYFSTRPVDNRSHWMPIAIHALPMKFTEAEFFELFSGPERGRMALNTLIECDVLKYDAYRFLTFTTKWKERKKLMKCEHDHG